MRYGSFQTKTKHNISTKWWQTKHTKTEQKNNVYGDYIYVLFTKRKRRNYVKIIYFFLKKRQTV